MVYSPKASAKDRKAAFSTAVRNEGSRIRKVTVNQPAPRLRPASVSVCTSMLRMPASSAR